MHHAPPDHQPGYVTPAERKHLRQEHREYLRELREEKSRDHFKGKDNLPPETLPPVTGLSIPLAHVGPLDLSAGVQNEDGLLDKPYARRRYDFHENPQLKGVLMLWVHITLFARSLTMTDTTAPFWNARSKAIVKTLLTAAVMAAATFITAHGIPTDKAGVTGLLVAIGGGIGALFTHSPVAPAQDAPKP